MARLRLLVAVLAIAVAMPARAESVADWRPYVAEASRRFGVPAVWIERVMRAESNGQTLLNGRPIRSRAGAIGLMQLIPETWSDIRRMLGLGPDPDDPRDNIFAGTFYLRMMYDRFGYPGMFAAYNAGPARYAAHLANGTALPTETITYLQAMGGVSSGAVRSVVQQRVEPLFALQRHGGQPSAAEAAERPLAALFVLRRDER